MIDYYPFGLAHNGPNELTRNRYLYSGKEFQNVSVNSDGSLLGLYDFGARYYDPLMGRWFNPDPALQGLNPYVYCGNNPIMFVDKDGEFTHLIFSALYGAVMNWISNLGNLNSKGDGWKFFGVGLLSGAISAGIGRGISSAIAGASFGAGFWGKATAKMASSSFLSGAAIGAGIGVSAGFISGFGNALIRNKSFGQALGQGGLDGLIVGAISAVSVGIAGGMDAALDGRRFWDGATVDKSTLVSQDIPIVGQRGDMNCGPASAEAIDRSLGGNMTQEQIRALPKLGGDPNTTPLGDKTLWEVFANERGYHEFQERVTDPTRKLSNLSTRMQNGQRVAISLNTGGNVGHSVVMKSITQKTVTKLNGSFVQRNIYKVMNPANGGRYMRISPKSITNAENIFFIHK